jgi:hypothetical protein
MSNPSEEAFQALVSSVERYPTRWSEVTWFAAIAALDWIDPANVEAFLAALESVVSGFTGP